MGRSGEVARQRVFTTAPGTNAGAFDGGDWTLTLVIAAIWGSSFLWIAIGLDSLGPGAIAFGRLILGTVALWAYPPARRPVPWSSWPAVAVVAVAGNAGPALLLAWGQQYVESSLAGMLNAATPLAVLVVGVGLTGRGPGRKQVIGLLVGFGGVIALAGPNVAGSGSQPVAVAMLLLAVVGYGVSNNVVVPLAQRYGAAAVIVRAQLIGAVLLAPLGLVDLWGATPTLASLGAVAILGVLGTGVARALNAQLAARTGAARGSVTTYLIPVVAIALGVAFRGDHIAAPEIAGAALILLGARLTTRPV